MRVLNPEASANALLAFTRGGYAQAEGTLRQLTDAGATLLASSCGACAGYGSSIPEGMNFPVLARRKAKATESSRLVRAASQKPAARPVAGFKRFAETAQGNN